MADHTQPATPAEFISAGADPAVAAVLATQANIMAGRGSANDRMALTQQLENLPPPATKSTTPPVTPAEATAALDAHENAALSAHFDALWAPPDAPEHYKFPLTSLADPTDEQFAQDTALKAAFYTEQIPQFVVESIAKSLAEQTRTLANETPAQAQSRIESAKVRLSKMWGGEFDANIQIVDTFLEQLGRRPELREFIGRAAPLLDPLSVDLLLQFAKHRAGRR